MKKAIDINEVKAQAQRLLVEAQKLPPGDARAEALKCVGKLRNDAQIAWNLAEDQRAGGDETGGSNVRRRAR
jgi:hypothetical protein